MGSVTRIRCMKFPNNKNIMLEKYLYYKNRKESAFISYEMAVSVCMSEREEHRKGCSGSFVSLRLWNLTRLKDPVRVINTQKLCSERVDRPALPLPLASERPCHVVTHAFIANQFMSWCRSSIKKPVLNASLSETVKGRSVKQTWVW